MRCGLLLAVVVCAGKLWCASPDQDPELARARAGLEKLRELVAAGAAPRLQLEKAEAALEDAQDVALLRRTLYGNEVTGEQADEMVAAAERRLDRRRKDLEKARGLVREGAASQLSLGTYLEEVDRSRKEYDLAVSRARLVRELAVMAEAERDFERRLHEAPAEAPQVAERYDGGGLFHPAQFQEIEAAFEREFSKPLPVSAMGETAVHRALGFDHRGRVDVALNPDQPEGVWLRRYLEARGIPYFAFRHAVPGKATGAHIHIGPMSTRLARNVNSGGATGR